MEDGYYMATASRVGSCCGGLVPDAGGEQLGPSRSQPWRPGEPQARTARRGLSGRPDPNNAADPLRFFHRSV
jgi:hypothetical protein